MSLVWRQQCSQHQNNHNTPFISPCSLPQKSSRHVSHSTTKYKRTLIQGTILHTWGLHFLPGSVAVNLFFHSTCTMFLYPVKSFVGSSMIESHQSQGGLLRTFAIEKWTLAFSTCMHMLSPHTLELTFVFREWPPCLCPPPYFLGLSSFAHPLAS